MLDDFINFIRENKLINPEGRTLLAISGGVDSVVMADLFHRAGYDFGIAHVNYHLRGEESERDERFVQNLAEKFHVEFDVKHTDTGKYARGNKISIQVAARQLRYEWFEELMRKKGYSRTAIAHHLDDQIETFLINLLRGTGIAGLHGILAARGKIIRPLMFTGRNEILDYARARNLNFVEDSSNLSDKYTRNRIRHKILPQIEKINPEYRKSLAETIEIIRQVETVYRQTIELKRNELFQQRENAFFIPIDEFVKLDPLAVWAYELLSPFGFNQTNIRDIIQLENASPGKEIVSATHRLVKDRDYLIILPIAVSYENNGQIEFEIAEDDIKAGIKFPLHLNFDVLEDIPEHLKEPPAVAYLDMEKLSFPLRLRKWRKGDSFFPLGMKNRKKLSDYFTDRKFSRIDKENQWLLCSGKDIVWIIGYRIDERYKVDSGTSKVLRIYLENLLNKNE